MYSYFTVSTIFRHGFIFALLTSNQIDTNTINSETKNCVTITLPAIAIAVGSCSRMNY